MAETNINRVMQMVREAGVLRARDLEQHGIPRIYLQRLKDRGLIQRVGHGMYTLQGAVLTERHSLAEACKRIPGGVVCLLSALRFHGLTNQNPFEVWMAVARKAWRPKAGTLPLRLVFASGPAFSEGVEEHDVEGVRVRVYSAAKTVADCFRYRNKIGVDVAVEALRDFRKRHPKDLDDLWRFSEIDRVSRVIRPYLESLQ
jgi:predicted transcriptional regulator of viral defense system